MVDGAHSAWKEDNITGVHLMHMKAAFQTVVRGRLIHAMKGKRIDGDLIGWTESWLLDRTVDMVLEGNVLQSHPLEAAVPQGSPMSLILFAIHTAGLITWVAESLLSVEGLSSVDDPGWVATRKDMNQLVKEMEAFTGESIE